MDQQQQKIEAEMRVSLKNTSQFFLFENQVSFQKYTEIYLGPCQTSVTELFPEVITT